MDPYVEASESDAAPIRTWCLVYDVETNEVVHTHEHLALDQDGSPNEEDLARAALAAVPSASEGKRLAVAHPAAGTQLAPGFDYSVDPESATIIARPAKEKVHRQPR